MSSLTEPVVPAAADVDVNQVPALPPVPAAPAPLIVAPDESPNFTFFRERDLMRFLNADLRRLVEMLNDQQYYAVTSILDWALNPLSGADSARTLVGFAGSGKTFCLRLISACLPSLVLCAPTNKACKELQKLKTGHRCCTIYSLLGLRMEQVEDTIQLTKTEIDKAGKYRFVVLDEAGMVNRELFGYIRDTMIRGTRFIFVGDPKQLPPVGEAESPVWDKFPTYKLLKVMRHDNQILKMATHVRKNKIRELEFVNDHADDEGVWYLDQFDFEHKIKHYADQGEFDRETKILAWRNRTVDRYNRLVRTAIYGKDLLKTARYLPNDRLVMTAPYEIDGQVALTTDDEVQIKDIHVSNLRGHDLQVYRLKVSGSTGTFTLTTIHEDSEEDLQILLADLAKSARAPKMGHLWRNFWALKKSLASVKFSYALTVHRSQGSTFENVFVDCDDILANSNRKEAKRCLYVAVSRPSKRLFLS